MSGPYTSSKKPTFEETQTIANMVRIAPEEAKEIVATALKRGLIKYRMGTEFGPDGLIKAPTPYVRDETRHH